MHGRQKDDKEGFTEKEEGYDFSECRLITAGCKYCE